jgi:hypothetical protein
MNGILGNWESENPTFREADFSGLGPAPNEEPARFYAIYINMSLSIHAASWGTEGITLTSPDDQEFDSLIRSLFKGNLEELLRSKPFLVIVSNHSARTIVAYTMEWTVEQNTTQVTLCQYKYPDAVGGAVQLRGNEIRSAEQKIVANGIEIYCGRWGTEPIDECYLRQLADWSGRFVGADIRVTLDAVIFEDGELIGPDKSHLGEHFAAYVNAKQDVYRSLVQGLDSGQSMGEAFRPIDEMIAAARANPGLIENPLAIWPRQAAGEALGWRKRYGDVHLPSILRRALRKEPFVIYRRDKPLSG